MRKLIVLLLAAMFGSLASAQQAPRVARVGILHVGTVATHGHLNAAIVGGLADLGYVEGTESPRAASLRRRSARPPTSARTRACGPSDRRRGRTIRACGECRPRRWCQRAYRLRACPRSGRRGVRAKPRAPRRQHDGSHEPKSRGRRQTHEPHSRGDADGGARRRPVCDGVSRCPRRACRNRARGSLARQGSDRWSKRGAPKTSSRPSPSWSIDEPTCCSSSRT